ncbi:MAG: hypothetical protein UIM26_02185 [Longicatena sp.]|nr:hypothetical protein [Longicatena sp.]
MVKKIVESEFENIQDVFEFNKIHPIVKDNNISGLLGYYSDGTDYIWGSDGALTLPSMLGYVQAILFINFVINYGYIYDEDCYLIASKIGKYKIPQLKKYEEKIEAYITEHPKK